MLLGQKAHTVGNTIRYEVKYSDWLDEGVTLTNATVVLDPAFTATVKDVTISGVVHTATHVYFLLAGGSLNETFTLDVQATDSRLEIKNDTLGFQVVAP
jgi:hypothetical protein